jgi:hypothetical protein
MDGLALTEFSSRLVGLATTRFPAKLRSLVGWSPPLTADKADDSY